MHKKTSLIEEQIRESADEKGFLRVGQHFIKFIKSPSEEEIKVFEGTYDTFQRVRLSIPYSEPCEYGHFSMDNNPVIYLRTPFVDGFPLFMTSYYADEEMDNMITQDLSRYYRDLEGERSVRGLGDMASKLAKWASGLIELSPEMRRAIAQTDRVFSRDMTPLNVLVDEKGKRTHVDIMNNDHVLSGCDEWYHYGFKPPQYFEEHLSTILGSQDAKSFSTIALLETVKFNGFFARNPQSPLKSGYGNMLRNCRLLLDGQGLYPETYDVLESLASQEDHYDLNKLMLEVVSNKREKPIFICQMGEMPRLDKRSYLIILGKIIPHLRDNSLQALSGRKGSIFLSSYLEQDKQVLELKDNGLGTELDAMAGGYGASPKGITRGRGLFFANLYTKSLGGSLELESSPNKGFKNRIVLPKSITINEEIYEYASSFP